MLWNTVWRGRAAATAENSSGTAPVRRKRRWDNPGREPAPACFPPTGLPVLRTEERRFKVCARRRTFPVIIPNANRPAVFRAGMQGCARIVCKAALGRGHGPAVPNDFFRLHILHGQLVGLLGHIFSAAAKLPAKVRDTVNSQRLAAVIGF